MFSAEEKAAIAEKVQQILRDTNHPELSENEINFTLFVEGAESWSWADIKNNGAFIVDALSKDEIDNMWPEPSEARIRHGHILRDSYPDPDPESGD